VSPADLPAWVPGALAALFGLNVGSFLNVVAHRLPLGLSVVRPRSRCPVCLTPIRAADNVPVLSWIALGGRCRGCKGAVSPRYAVVELLTGALFLHVVWALVAGPGRLGEGAAWAHAAVVLVAVAAMLAASLVDLDHRILPDEITKTGMWAGPVACAFVPEVVLGRGLEVPSWVPAAWPLPLQAALVSGLGVAVGAGLLWGLGAIGSNVLGKEAMGFGDVKFLGAIGGFVGPILVLLVLVLAAVLGAVVGLARRAATGDRYLPFGPYLAIGAHVALLHGPALVGWYLGLARIE
jgi:leader peptidase (prepilin peptidase)/N-methyltransferase